MPWQNRETAEDAKVRYSAAYPTGRERIGALWRLGFGDVGKVVLPCREVKQVV